MTAEETGAYIRLLCYQWQKYGVPNDDKKLQLLTGVSGEALQNVKQKFSIVRIVNDSERLFNERLDETLTKAKAYSQTQTDNANNRWKKKQPVEQVESVPDKSKEEREQYENLQKAPGFDSNFIKDFILKNKPTISQPYVDLWNRFAEKYGKAKVSKISDTRKRKLAVRIRDKDFNLVELLLAAGKQEFALKGKWFSFDWLIENDTNYLKIKEKKYDSPIKEEKEEAAGLKKI